MIHLWETLVDIYYADELKDQSDRERIKAHLDYLEGKLFHPEGALLTPEEFML